MAVAVGYPFTAPLARLPPHLYYHLVGPQALSLSSPLHPCPYTRPVPFGHVSSLQSLGVWFSLQYNMVGQAPGLAPGAACYLQAPPPVCRDGATFGMIASAVKRTKTAAGGGPFPSPSPDAETLLCESPSCATPDSLIRACISKPASPHVDRARGRMK